MKKMSGKKALLAVLSLCMVIFSSVMITVAYLSDSASVVNTFSVGQVEIELDETLVDEEGTPVGDLDDDGEDDRTNEGNNYHLIPGSTYVKDPTLTLKKGSEESYVRMMVTLNCYDSLIEIFGDEFLPQYFVEGWDSELWVSTKEIKVDETNDTVTYEFRYHKSVVAKDEALKLEPLFTHLIVPKELTKEELKKIQNLNMKVEAHAIQKSGFTLAEDAWKNFTK